MASQAYSLKIRSQQKSIGSATWIANEKENVRGLLEAEMEEALFPVQYEMEWLNEHMAGIFGEDEVNVTEVFKTPGKLRGKTPSTARKYIGSARSNRAPLSDIFAARNGKTPDNRFHQALERLAEDRGNAIQSPTPANGPTQDEMEGRDTVDDEHHIDQAQPTTDMHNTDQTDEEGEQEQLGHDEIQEPVKRTSQQISHARDTPTAKRALQSNTRAQISRASEDRASPEESFHSPQENAVPSGHTHEPAKEEAESLTPKGSPKGHLTFNENNANDDEDASEDEHVDHIDDHAVNESKRRSQHDTQMANMEETNVEQDDGQVNIHSDEIGSPDDHEVSYVHSPSLQRRTNMESDIEDHDGGEDSHDEPEPTLHTRSRLETAQHSSPKMHERTMRTLDGEASPRLRQPMPARSPAAHKNSPFATRSSREITNMSSPRDSRQTNAKHSQGSVSPGATERQRACSEVERPTSTIGTASIRRDDMEVQQDKDEGLASTRQQHQKSSTQLLHEKISMLGKSRPSRVTKSSAKLSLASRNSVAYPDLGLGGRESGERAERIPPKTPYAQTSSPGRREQGTGVMSRPLSGYATWAQRSSASRENMAEPRNSRSRSPVGDGRVPRDDEFARPTSLRERSPQKAAAGIPRPGSTTKYATFHAKSNSASAIPSPSRRPVLSGGANGVTADGSVDGHGLTKAPSNPAARSSVHESPTERYEAPLSVSKGRLQSIMQSAKGLFMNTGDAATTARKDPYEAPSPSPSSRQAREFGQGVHQSHTATVEQNDDMYPNLREEFELRTDSPSPAARAMRLRQQQGSSHGQAQENLQRARQTRSSTEKERVEREMERKRDIERQRMMREREEKERERVRLSMERQERERQLERERERARELERLRALERKRELELQRQQAEAEAAAEAEAQAEAEAEAERQKQRELELEREREEEEARKREEALQRAREEERRQAAEAQAKAEAHAKAQAQAQARAQQKRAYEQRNAESKASSIPARPATAHGNRPISARTRNGPAEPASSGKDDLSQTQRLGASQTLPSRSGISRVAKPTREVGKQKPTPLNIRVGTLSSQRMPISNNTFVDPAESNDAAQQQPPRPMSRTLKKKPSTSALHSSVTGAGTNFKSSTSSASAPKTKATLAAERKRELEQRREAERKQRAAAAAAAAEEEEALRQEAANRAEAERREHERERVGGDDPKKLAHMQAIEKRRLEVQRKMEQQRKRSTVSDEYAGPGTSNFGASHHGGGEKPPSISRPHTSAAMHRPDGGASTASTTGRPLSRFGGIAPPPARPSGFPMVNPAKPPKRPADPDGVTRTVTRKPSGVQEADGKRRKTDEELEYEQQQALQKQQQQQQQQAGRMRSTMAPPTRPSQVRKMEAMKQQPGYRGYAVHSQANAPVASSSSSVFKNSLTGQGPRHFNPAGTIQRPGHPLDMAKYAHGKIPFAEPQGSPPPAAAAPPPASAHRTPSAAQTNKIARSSPMYQNGETISLPEIPTDSEDSDSEVEPYHVPDWAKPENLHHLLVEQEGKDGERVFGPTAPLHMEEIFKDSKNRHKFRERTSSANWNGPDGLTQDEINWDMQAREKMKRNGGWMFGL